MAAEQATAIVLRTYDFSESSLVTTLFTREFGKIRALAKGAKRPKNPFDFGLDLLSQCRIVFLRKSGDVLHLLTEAKLERRFRVERAGLGGWYAALYAGELVNLLTDEEDAFPEVFDSLAQFLEVCQGREHVKEHLLHFEWQLLEQTGHTPSLENCVSCGNRVARLGEARIPGDVPRLHRPQAGAQQGQAGLREVQSGPRGTVHFSLVEGGVLCAECRPGKRSVLAIRGETLATLQKLGRQQWSGEPLSPQIYGELRGLLNQYFCHLLGQRPRMHDYLGLLGN